MGSELPALTKVVIALSELMARWGLPALVLLAIGAVAFARLLRRPAFRLRFDALVLRAPLVGRLVRDVHAAQLARTLSIMLASGLPMMEGLVIRSEEHTSELQSLMRISYAVFCLKKNRIK